MVAQSCQASIRCLVVVYIRHDHLPIRCIIQDSRILHRHTATTTSTTPQLARGSHRPRPLQRPRFRARLQQVSSHLRPYPHLPCHSRSVTCPRGEAAGRQQLARTVRRPPVLRRHPPPLPQGRGPCLQPSPRPTFRPCHRALPPRTLTHRASREFRSPTAYTRSRASLPPRTRWLRLLLGATPWLMVDCTHLTLPCTPGLPTTRVSTSRPQATRFLRAPGPRHPLPQTGPPPNSRPCIQLLPVLRSTCVTSCSLSHRRLAWLPTGWPLRPWLLHHRAPPSRPDPPPSAATPPQSSRRALQRSPRPAPPTPFFPQSVPMVFP